MREPPQTGVPALARKSFLVTPVGSDLPQKAIIQTMPNPALIGVEALPAEVRRAYEEEFAADGLKLTMPDGSEWYIEDVVWEEVLNLVRAHREYVAAAQ
jgi:hypothetical protein